MNILRYAINSVHSPAANSKILVNRRIHQDFFISVAFFLWPIQIAFSQSPAAEAIRLFHKKQSVAPVTGFNYKEKM
jgi:hypothetical protein